MPSFTPATIDSVDVDGGEVEVTFTIDGYDRDDVDVEITLARWVPEEDTWLNMLMRPRARDTGAEVIRAGNLRLQGDDAVTGGEDGTFTTKIKSPTADYGGPGPVDFSGGVVWRRDGEDSAAHYCGDDADYCEFVQSILDRIADLGSGWDPDGTYRVGVTSRDIGIARFNAIADFAGDGTLLPSRTADHMTESSCSSCHGERIELGVHGNQRHDPAVCVSCHNEFTFDAASSAAEPDGWAAIDAQSMIHRLHMGIDGYSVDGRDYSDVRFPDWTFGRGVGPKNCVSCHQEDAPADEAAWNVVTFEACTTCHIGDTLEEAMPHLPDDHPSNPDCGQCHTPSSDSFIPSADEIHGVSERLGALARADDYQVHIAEVSGAVAGQEPEVVWQVVDSAGTAYDFSEITAEDFHVGIGWGHGDDWINDGVPSRATGARGDPWPLDTADVDTVFSGDQAITTLPALPPEAAAGRNGYVAIYPDGPGIVHDEVETRPNTAVATITLGADVAQDPENDRRPIVSAENCQSCHTTIERHGTVAGDDIAGCVVCHNAGSLSRDDSAMQGSVDFMYLLHAVHSLGDGKREFFERRRGFDEGGYGYVTHANSSLDCQSCHVGDSYRTPIDPAHRLGIIADDAKAAFEAGTGVNSPQASTCYSCHETGIDSEIDSSLKAHMSVLGGHMFGEESHESLLERHEACEFCHD